TAEAFRWVRARSFTAMRSRQAKTALRSQLTKGAAASKIFEFCALCWSAQESGLSNDFESPVFQRYPRLAVIKRDLLRRGATEASLAGSGSAVFGVFPSPAMARRAAVGFPHDQAFVCETISRDRYVRALGSAGVGLTVAS